MKTPTLIICRYGNAALVVMILFLLHACTFPKGVKLYKQDQPELSKPLMERSLNHRYYSPGARFYLGKIRIREEQNTPAWLEVCQLFCELEDEVNGLSAKQITKLKNQSAGRSDIMNARENLQKRIFERMMTTGSISELRLLEAQKDCWSRGALDSIRKMITNETIDPKQQVFPGKIDENWIGQAVELPTEEEIISQPDRSCSGLLNRDRWNLDYEDARIIAEFYTEEVLPTNYAAFWEIRRNLWDIFQIHHSYCEMDRFREEQQDIQISLDCWFDTARDTLCLGELRPLLAFHRNNPHTGLDVDICNQILCLSNYAPDVLRLNAAEKTQVEDIRLMSDLQGQLLDCQPQFDSTELIAKVEYLSKKYQHHQAVFDLAWAATNYFLKDGRLDLTRNALATFQPLFPDSSVCSQTDFYFQVDKQTYFNSLASLLREHEGNTMALPTPATAWNTPDNDEYGLVAYGETDEVFFVRRNRSDGSAKVMTSRRKGEQWTTPVPVPELSVNDDIVPFSISENGMTMLLGSRGDLSLTYRPKIGRRWLKPQSIQTSKRFAGHAWLSPDDSLLLQEYYVQNVSALRPPDTDIAVAKLTPQGGYGRLYSIGDSINVDDASDTHPNVALGGRLILFSSDRKGGLGERDMYSATMSKPWNWATATQGKNLGLELNTMFDDEGVSYFSEYTGDAYLHRYDRCTQDKDIWYFKLGPGVFPANAMRLAGKVIDENGEAVSGGFMEFTPNYQLNVHAQPISSKGTYTYTVPDSTEIVRLFPEVPGYYSEHDTTHHLSQMARGEIVRDTFLLLSFDYLRRTFELEHSTFYNGRSEFDQPKKAYPELTRLAKIAVRMGADIELTGHTDGTGAESGNKQLSIDRAASVKRFLVEKCGFNPARIRVYGYGASRPVCDNDTEEGRRCNRRVEVVFKMPNLPEDGNE